MNEEEYKMCQSKSIAVQLIFELRFVQTHICNDNIFSKHPSSWSKQEKYRRKSTDYYQFVVQ